MATNKKIVILGGSYSGISTSHYLLKHAIPQLPENEYQIVLISASTQALCRPACPRAMISDEMFDQAKLFVSVAKQFEQYPKASFAFIHGSATRLDNESRMVTVKLASGEVETIEYYTLVIATGAWTSSPLLGLNGDAKDLRSEWEGFRKALPTAKDVIISGGGPAGIEVAGELGEYLNGRPGWFGGKLANPKVSITVYTAGSQILPVLRPSLGKKAEDLLANVGVTVVRNARVKSVEAIGGGALQSTSKVAITLDDGKKVEADLYIPATGVTPNTGFIDKSLLTSDGRIDTNPSTFRVEKAGARVYAVGDVSSAARPAVHLILEAIPVLCANVKRDLLLDSGAEKSSIGEDRLFKEDTRETQMVPIGKSKGVGAAMGYQLPSFLVWLIKGRDYWLWTTGGLWSGKQWAKEK